MPRELHVHSVPTRAEYFRTIVEIVAILAAGLWAIYTFVYDQRIKPLLEPPSFAVPTDVVQGPSVGGVVFLTIHKRLQNTGNVPIDIAAEALSVYGETIAQRATRSMAPNSPYHAEVRYDVPRHIVKLLFSFVKLRSGAVRGDPSTNFVVPPHSSLDEDLLVAVPVKSFPVVHIMRKDYVRKFPVFPKVDVRIVKTLMNAYDLHSADQVGEYDSEQEYAIKR